ncbi:hypothetical protein [Pseudozobellia thermophila]|uniref:Uncharacterized protein n=1 Tax=Pseudozobellia thermophila TaxID=192903 RepID=A0A1M6CVS8_9FLAO|nr:hypothetical protein [Pseudozobellia thermophila]SHI65069.1 hypothetical protein SAMN04488513_101894 [Pseudozobellia thermophila]
MKSYIILFVVALMLVKPFWPVVEYIVNYDYIKNVLCENKDRPQLECDGKCYLAKLLAEETEKNEKNPFGEKQSKLEIQNTVFFQVLPQAISLNLELGPGKSYNATALNVFISTELTSDISQPPENV